MADDGQGPRSRRVAAPREATRTPTGAARGASNGRPFRRRTT